MNLLSNGLKNYARKLRPDIFSIRKSILFVPPRNEVKVSFSIPLRKDDKVYSTTARMALGLHDGIFCVCIQVGESLEPLSFYIASENLDFSESDEENGICLKPENVPIMFGFLLHKFMESHK